MSDSVSRTQPLAEPDDGIDLIQARSPKGERTTKAILSAALEIIDRQGLAAASQEAIARKAGISQSTLRHYFPTKDKLHSAIFSTQYRKKTLATAMEQILLRPEKSPVEKIKEMVQAHLSHIITSSDAVAFEHYAHMTRDGSDRAVRDEWYSWLLQHYAVLIQQVNTKLSKEDCETRAYQIITLCLGAWITLGKSRPRLIKGTAEQLKVRLSSLVDQLIN